MITKKEALIELKEMSKCIEKQRSKYLNDVFKLSIEALEKQVAKKVDKSTKGVINFENALTTYKCPNCNATLVMDWQAYKNCCPNCMQRLDWSVEE